MKLTIEKLSRALGSRILARILIGIVALSALTAVFEIGVFVGFHKASFAYRWEKNYEHNFGDLPFGGAFIDSRLPNPHGATGTIGEVSLPTFTIIGERENEKTVRIATSTMLRAGTQTLSPADLTAGQKAVVIGTPNETGEIEAALIRIFPTP